MSNIIRLTWYQLNENKELSEVFTCNVQEKFFVRQIDKHVPANGGYYLILQTSKQVMDILFSCIR